MFEAIVSFSERFMLRLYGKRLTGVVVKPSTASGSRTGNRSFSVPEQESIPNPLESRILHLLRSNPSSILGRNARFGSVGSVWESDTNSFPYQELNSAVLVWHATCNRKGQFPSPGPEWEERKTGNREQGTDRCFGDLKLTTDH